MFINEVRTGKRERSVVTNHTTGSLSADEKEAWRQLRKELESVGVTPALFEQHRDLVIEKLLNAIEEGNLAENTGTSFLIPQVSQQGNVWTPQIPSSTMSICSRNLKKSCPTAYKDQSKPIWAQRIPRIEPNQEPAYTELKHHQTTYLLFG